MVWFLILAWIGLIASTIAICVWYQSLPITVAVCLVAGLIAGCLAVFSYNRALEYQRSKCRGWGRSALLETKYVNIGYGDWACWAHVDGRWLPIERVRAIEGMD